MAEDTTIRRSRLVGLEALAEYAQHDSWRCEYPKMYPWNPDCYCGLTAVQRAAGVPVDVPREGEGR